MKIKKNQPVATLLHQTALRQMVRGKLFDATTLQEFEVGRHLQQAGRNTVGRRLLEWTNDGCPYVHSHYASGNMQKVQQDLTAAGAVWLSIISSAPGKQGYVSGAQANELTTSRDAHPTAVLLDPTGTIGRAYEAQTTPQMFVIDKAGVLRYMGAIDDQPTPDRSAMASARNYVREAFAAVSAGKQVAEPATDSYGCSVKY